MDLRTLSLDVQRYRESKASLEKLLAIQEQLTAKVQTLEKASLREEKAVNKLRRPGLRKLVYQASGKLEQKLADQVKKAEKTRREFDSAVQELARLSETVRGLQAELDVLGDCEARLERRLEEKRAAILESGGPGKDQLEGKERTLNFLKAQQRQLGDAIDKGQRALTMTEQMLAHLQGARGWGELDLAGGGLFADMKKEERLDDARFAAKQMQLSLEDFRSALANTDVRSGLRLSLDGLLRSGGIVDSLVTDLRMLDRLGRAEKEVQDCAGQIRSILSQLELSLNASIRKQEKTTNAMRKLIVELEL